MSLLLHQQTSHPSVLPTPSGQGLFACGGGDAEFTNIKLTVEVISGWQLPRGSTVDDILDAYVEVSGARENRAGWKGCQLVGFDPFFLFFLLLFPFLSVTLPPPLMVNLSFTLPPFPPFSSCYFRLR